MTSIQIQPVIARRELRAFVKFPWQVYKNDSNWVPPIISERLEYLDPAKGPFYRHAEVALFTARRSRKVVGSIAAFVDHHRVEQVGQQEGGFGFFEVIEDYAVAEQLLDAACGWLRERNASVIRGPTNFGDNDCPGVLIEGADCPPVMLEAHTPAYYPGFLERYGMQKDHDLYAWRAFSSQVAPKLDAVRSELVQVADVARQRTDVTIRKVRMKEWETEIAIAHHLFDTTLQNVIPSYVPIPKAEFQRTADQVRPFLDPDLVLFAEVDGKPVGFFVAFPDLNRALIRLNGRLFPLGWLKIQRYIRQVDVATFKLMGVLQEYRRRGIDAMLYLEGIKAFLDKDYDWLDGSLTSEENPMINLIASRMGAERYKLYRLYEMAL